MFIKSVKFKMPVDADHAADMTERTDDGVKEEVDYRDPSRMTEK